MCNSDPQYTFLWKRTLDVPRKGKILPYFLTKVEEPLFRGISSVSEESKRSTLFLAFFSPWTEKIKMFLWPHIFFQYRDFFV